MVNIFRNSVDSGYDLIRDWLFYFTKNDPELAHEYFISFANKTSNLDLEKLLLNNSSNKVELPFEFSNAAGFNKNGDINPDFLKALGFNRIVVGTVTHEAWDGNPKAKDEQRIWRFPQNESLVNWLGLPGVGSKRVRENLESFGNIGLPLTINIMATPKFDDNGKIIPKVGEEILRDLEGSLYDTRFFGDVIELNESCPNVEKHKTNDFQKAFSDRLEVVCNNSYEKKVRVKISPDLPVEIIFETLDVIEDYIHSGVSGIVGTNTTTKHNSIYIPNSPLKGGASGRAVKTLSMEMQEKFIEEIIYRNLPLEYISVGGIDSVEEVGKRLEYGASGIQLFTGLIYKGPRLLREIRDSTFLKSYHPKELKF